MTRPITTGRELLSRRKEYAGPKTRVHEDRFPKDVLPAEFAAMIWHDDGYWKQIGVFDSQEKAEEELDPFQSAEGHLYTKST